MIGLRVKTAGDLARQLRKCTGYMLPSLVYPAISSTKLAAFVIRHNAGRKRAGHAINDGTCVHHFLSVALVAYTCSESDKIYRMQHFWYNVVMPCFASFSRFRFFYYFVIGQKYVRKIETSRNWQNMASLHCTTSAAAHKIYPTLNNCVQPEQWTKTLNIRSHDPALFRPALCRTTKEASFVLLMAG